MAEPMAKLTASAAAMCRAFISILPCDIDHIPQRLAGKITPDVVEKNVEGARDVVLDVVGKYVRSDDEVRGVPQRRLRRQRLRIRHADHRAREMTAAQSAFERVGINEAA